MAVKVDEAGANNGPVYLDGAGGREVGGVPTQDCEAAAADANVRTKPVVPRSVQDPATANQQVKHPLPLSGVRQRQRPQGCGGFGGGGTAYSALVEYGSPWALAGHLPQGNRGLQTLAVAEEFDHHLLVHAELLSEKTL